MSDLNPWEKQTLKQANEELKRNIDDMIDSMILQARLTRAKYDALIAQGFNEMQAIELCKQLTF